MVLMRIDPSPAPRFAVCVAQCGYYGHTWRPLIEVDPHGGFICSGLECPSFAGAMGQVKVCVGVEEGEEAARARAESLVEPEH